LISFCVFLLWFLCLLHGSIIFPHFNQWNCFKLSSIDQNFKQILHYFGANFFFYFQILIYFTQISPILDRSMVVLPFDFFLLHLIGSICPNIVWIEWKFESTSSCSWRHFYLILDSNFGSILPCFLYVLSNSYFLMIDLCLFHDLIGSFCSNSIQNWCSIIIDFYDSFVSCLWSNLNFEPKSIQF